MKTLIAATALVLATTGCTEIITNDNDKPPSFDPVDVDLRAQAVWDQSSPAERAAVCEEFWATPDADLLDFFMAPGPDQLTRAEGQALIDMMWREC